MNHPLLRLRYERRMSRSDLADAAGLSLRTIRNIEERDNEPQEDTLFKLADALGMEPVDLAAALAGDEPKEVAA